MIMTAELNSHQRISYYTGVKLIRHNQHNNSSNNTNNGNNTNPTSNGGSSTTTGGGFYQHNQHHHPSQQQQQGQHRYPPPPPHPQHRHQQAQHHPPPHLTPHHPSHFHLPCPTGPPHIQHPGGAPLHLKNHGPPLPNNHQGNPQSYGPGNNGGSNQTTRLYTGSPLIRSTTYNSTFGSIGGSGANHKRSYRHHHHNRNHQNSHSHHHHSHHSNNGRQGSFHLNQHNHHHHPHQNIIGGSCSSGTSSSSSSNEHLNHLQSPTEKLDISPLKLSSSSPPSHEESSSSPSSLSSNSSPGPQGSPSPSSGSPSSTDGNKDLDHFYFLEEHWKPTSDGNSSIGNSSHDSTRDIIIMDMSSSMSSSSHSSGSSGQWISSGSSGGGSPSPPIPPTPATTMTMMVDQFFATGGGIGDGGHNNNNFAGLEVDCNNNVVGTAEHPDFADLGMPPPHGDQQQQRRFLYQDNYNSFNGCSGVIGAGCIGGSSGLINFGGRKVNGDQNEILPSVPSSTTVVNVETQIGTFNGQRDLEIRLCFIKGDNHLGGNVQGNTGENFLHGKDTDFVRENCEKNPIIGDPFANNDKSPGSQNSSQAKQGKNVSQDMEQLSLGQSQKVSPLN